MKRYFVFLISVFIPCVIIAQIQTYVQTGIVRSQSFPGKVGTRIIGAEITRVGNNVNKVTSLETPEEGYFELPLDNMNKSKVFYISFVKGPKGSDYKLMYPLPNERLEFTPNAHLTIIMQSEKEKRDFVNAAIATMRKDLDRQLQDSIKVIDKLRKTNKILDEQYNQLYNRYYDLCSDNKKLLELYIKDLAQHDFESRASSQQEIDIAIASGNYQLAKKLLAGMGTREEIINDIKNDSIELINLRSADSLIVDRIIRKKKDAIINFDQNIATYLGVFENDSVWKYKIAKLSIDPLNVNFLCECGEFIEIYYNNYNEAKDYYLKALEQVKTQKLSIQIDAICHNHLGDVYNALSEYALAKEQYNQASKLLDSRKYETSKDVFDSYLGLGNVYYIQAKFDEALIYYRKCIVPSVKLINRKSFWQARIGIAKIKFIKGDYQGAKADFSTILKEIESIKDVDIVSLSMAYSSMIECISTIGQYQTAIDICDVAIKLIKKRSSPRNTYIADIMVHKGNAFINMGMIKEGELCMNEAIEIYKNILGEEHPNYASACVQFADYYNLIGELKKSEDMCSKALELFNRKFGMNHFATISAHFSKCQLYNKCAEFAKAKAELDTISTIYKSSGLFNDYQRIKINTIEASMKIAQGESSKGINVLLDAVDCVTNTLSKESVQLIDLYNQIAAAYLEQLENEKAKVFLDNAQSLTNKIFGSRSPTAIMQQMGMGQYYVNRGEYHKAYELYSMIEKSAIETFGEDNHQLCVLYGMLGDYHKGQYQFDKAYYYYNKQYNIVKTTYGENHFYIAAPITRLGAYYMQTGDFINGIKKAQIAYEILSSHFGVGHKETLTSQLGICTAHIQFGDFDTAGSILADLSKSVEKTLGKDHWLYSDVLRIKAILHQSRGEFGKAIEETEKAIRIVETIFGRYHSNTIQLYEQLSELYSELCNFPKAIENNDIAISIAINYYGKDNVGVMPYLINKGNLCASLNRISEAHNIYKKVKEVYIEHFGDSCKILSTVLIPEALLLVQEGYGEQAIEILKNIEPQMVSVYGENNVQLCKLYNTIATSYQSVMQFIDAKGYFKKSIDNIKGSLGDNNASCIWPLVGLGQVLLQEDAIGTQIVEAKRLLSRACFISTAVYGSNNTNTACIDALLGQISLRQGNLQDAYMKFQKYSRSIRQTLGKDVTIHSRVSDAHMNMGNYYMAKANDASFKQDSIGSHHYASQAKEEFEKAKNIIEVIYGNDYAGIANSLNAIAQTYILLHQPDSAVSTYIKASELTIKQFGSHSPLAAQAHAILGATYKYWSDQTLFGDQEKLQKAKECYIRAIAIRENCKGFSRVVQRTSTMDWRINLSAIYMKLIDYENAFNTIDNIISELEGLKLDNKNALYLCYCTKANMFVESNRDPKNALEYLSKAEELFSQLTFQNNLIKEIQQLQLMFSYGSVYEKSGDTNEAIKSYEHAYDILRMLPSNSQINAMKQTAKDKIEELMNNNLTP